MFHPSPFDYNLTGFVLEEVTLSLAIGILGGGNVNLYMLMDTLEVGFPYR